MQSKNPKLPRQILYIVGNEGCERFSFYGMRSILVVFMVERLMMTANQSTTVYHLFMAGCYFTPLFGAWLADKVWGRYRTIMYLSLVYCAGHAVLAWKESPETLYIGLGLIAVGTGGIKPCVSAFVADQIPESEAHLRKKVFEIFYWMINFGAFFSTLLIPYVRKVWGAPTAFAIPGVLMGVATWIFWLGRRHYVMFPPRRETASFPEVIAYSVRQKLVRSNGASRSGKRLLDYARDKYPPELVDAMDSALGVMRLFFVVSVFWALFDQNGSSWVLQARSMNLEIGLLRLEPDQMQAANPIIVMVLIPIFSKGLYPLLDKLGWSPTPLRRMTAGMVIAGASFAYVALLQHQIDQGRSLSVLWQLVAYFILTSGEVMLSITGLEFAYSQAPASMKSTLMSFWLLTTVVGNVLTAAVEQWSFASSAMKFAWFAVAMWVAAGVFGWMARRYARRVSIALPA